MTSGLAAPSTIARERPPPKPSYRDLAAIPGFLRLVGASLVAEIANQMQVVVLVLLALQGYRSPRLAGLVVFAAILPGLVLSPLAGALLDRYGRVLLISLDYVVGAAALLAVAALHLAGRLPAAGLVVIVAAASLTTPLRAAGTRALLPLLVPRNLWDRANALDSGRYVVAAVLGPPLAGGVVALRGAAAGLCATAAVLVVGAALLVGLRVPTVPQRPRGRLAADAWAGLRYVLGNHALRWLAVTVSVFNVGGGILYVALPVLVLHRLGGNPALVGAMWTVYGIGGLVGGLLAGRLDSEHREWLFLAVGGALDAVGMVLLLVAPNLGVVALSQAVAGFGNGPLDIGLFSLRQRATPPQWYGRAFAVSMSLNYLGVPLGSAVAGPLLAVGLVPALAVAALATGIAAVLPVARLRHWEVRAAVVGADAERPTPGEGAGGDRQTLAGSRTGGSE